MRSRVIESSRSRLVAVLLALGLSACIIGPKQDDPEPSLSPGGPSDAGFDGGAALDDDAGDKVSDATVADTSAPDTSTSSDASSDASSDGGSPDGCRDADACSSDGASDGAVDSARESGLADVLGGD